MITGIQNPVNTGTPTQLKEEMIGYIGREKGGTTRNIAFCLYITESLAKTLLSELRNEGRIHLWNKCGTNYWMITTPKKD